MKLRLPRIATIAFLLLVIAGVVACGGGDDDGASGTPGPVANGPPILTLAMDSKAMEPAIAEGAEVKVYAFDRTVRAGDLIAFTAAPYFVTPTVRRVLGTPGQAVEIAPNDNTLSVGGVAIDEPYTRGDTTCGAVCIMSPPAAQAPIPQSGAPNATELLVNLGSDAARREQQQEACQRVACYVVLSDNRIALGDSRDGWFVPVQNIIGYVVPD